MKAISRLWLAGLIALISPGFLVAATGKTQPINIKSDHARYEVNRGVYTGNVVMEQGPLRIEADKIIIFGVNRKVERLQSFGHPTRFFHRNPDGSVTQASAENIEYRIADEMVVLEQKASILHQGSELHGERIVYNSGQQTVSAQGGSDNGERVQMILQPQTASDEAAPADQESKDDNARTESP